VVDDAVVQRERAEAMQLEAAQVDARVFFGAEVEAGEPLLSGSSAMCASCP
jgi:hypothetical protein